MGGLAQSCPNSAQAPILESKAWLVVGFGERWVGALCKMPVESPYRLETRPDKQIPPRQRTQEAPTSLCQLSPASAGLFHFRPQGSGLGCLTSNRQVIQLGANLHNLSSGQEHSAPSSVHKISRSAFDYTAVPMSLARCGDSYPVTQHANR